MCLWCINETDANVNSYQETIGCGSRAESFQPPLPPHHLHNQPYLSKKTYMTPNGQKHLKLCLILSHQPKKKMESLSGFFECLYCQMSLNFATKAFSYN